MIGSVTVFFLLRVIGFVIYAIPEGKGGGRFGPDGLGHMIWLQRYQVLGKRKRSQTIRI